MQFFLNVFKEFVPFKENGSTNQLMIISQTAKLTLVMALTKETHLLRNVAPLYLYS